MADISKIAESYQRSIGEEAKVAAAASAAEAVKRVAGR